MRRIAVIALESLAAILLSACGCYAQPAATVLVDGMLFPKSIDREVSSFCVKAKLTCVIDMSASPTQCKFDESFHVDMRTAPPQQGRRLIAQRCSGYRWRKSKAIYIFEPRRASDSALGVKIAALSSERNYPAKGYILQLVAAAGIVLAREYEGSGMRPAPRKYIHYKTPAGTLKNALLIAAEQYPGTSWSVALLEKGYRVDVVEPQTSMPHQPKVHPSNEAEK